MPKISTIDRSRFEQALVPHLDAAFNLARWLMGSPADAEDAVQEAFLRALTFFDKFRGSDGRPWLLAIVRHVCYDSLRKNCRLVDITDPTDVLNDAADQGPSPEMQQLRLADQRQVTQALDSLQPEYREVLVLRELEGLSYRQIAEVTEVPIGTVMSRLARARKRLEHALIGAEGETR